MNEIGARVSKIREQRKHHYNYTLLFAGSEGLIFLKLGVWRGFVFLKIGASECVNQSKQIRRLLEHLHMDPLKTEISEIIKVPVLQRLVQNIELPQCFKLIEIYFFDLRRNIESLLTVGFEYIAIEKECDQSLVTSSNTEFLQTFARIIVDFVLFGIGQGSVL